MQHRYLPHTQEDIRQMLDVVGVGSLEELYADVPGSVKLKDGYELPRR